MYLENHFSKNCYCNIHLLKEKRKNSVMELDFFFYLFTPPPLITLSYLFSNPILTVSSVCLLFCSQFVIWIVNLCTVMNFLFCWSTNLFFLGYIYLFFLFFKCILYLISFIYAKSTDKQRFGSQAHLSIR